MLIPLMALALGAAQRAPVKDAGAALSDLSLEALMNVEVRSVGRKRQRLGQAAAAVLVISAEDIRRFGATSIPEVLRMAPGLRVARIDSNKWAIGARGFNGRFATGVAGLPPGTIALLRGSPQFGSESVVSYEAGVRRELGRRVSADMAVFEGRYEGLQTFEAGAPSLNAVSRALVIPFTYANGSAARTRGIETAATVRLPGGWRIGGNHGGLQVRSTRAPLYLPGLGGVASGGLDPAHQAFVRAEWEPGKRWSFDTSYYYLSRLAGAGVPALTRLDTRGMEIRRGWRDQCGRAQSAERQASGIPTGGFHHGVERTSFGVREIESAVLRTMRPLIIAATVCAGLAANTPASLETEVKAAMLFNFTKFVEWTPTPARPVEAPVVLAVLGDDGIGAVLERAVRDKHVAGMPVAVRRIDSARDAAGCHVVYVVGCPRDMVGVLKSLNELGALTVGDDPRFLGAGGMVALATRDNRVRFSINADRAQRSGVRISSRLLWLADNGKGEAH